MKITAVLHRPVTDPAGAEQMLNVMLTYLARRGHDITVVVPPTNGTPAVSPIEHVFSLNLVAAIKGADLVLTHLDAAKKAIAAAQMVDLPVIQVLHNNHLRDKDAVKIAPMLIGLIFNSRWMERDWIKIRPELPRCMVYPPVNPAHYTTLQRDALVTQINLFKNGELLWRVARLLPETRFLAVKGGYGHQVMPKIIPSNVEVIEPTNDPTGRIYARTRILLVPSLYESWGRVGMEAASSGIPVIASTAPGLQESLDYAGLFRDPESPRHWAEAITALSDPDIYAMYSCMACRRAREVWRDTRAQLKELEQFIVSTSS